MGMRHMYDMKCSLTYTHRNIRSNSSFVKNTAKTMTKTEQEKTAHEYMLNIVD